MLTKLVKSTIKLQKILNKLKHHNFLNEDCYWPLLIQDSEFFNMDNLTYQGYKITDVESIYLNEFNYYSDESDYNISLTFIIVLKNNIIIETEQLPFTGLKSNYKLNVEKKLSKAILKFDENILKPRLYKLFI